MTATFWMKAHFAKVPFPAKETPAWATKSDRWYQLDQAGYSFPQAYTLLQESLGPRPDFLILASPEASNATDRDFASTGASSPSKFVHTLPNIRAVALLQAMEWAGPMLCVQNDPKSFLSGLETALLELEVKPSLSSVWVIGFIPETQRVELFEVTRHKPAHLSPNALLLEVSRPAATEDLQTKSLERNTDKEWLDWVYNGRPSGFNLSKHYVAFLSSGD